MIKLIYILKEVFLNIARHLGIAVGSFLSLTLLFLLFDLFWVAADTSEAFYQQVVSQLQMDVYLSENLADSTLDELRDEISDLPGVAAITFVSKEMARGQLSQQVGVDLLVGYDSLNPLPRSFNLEFEPKHLNLEAMAHIEDKLTLLPGVTDINYSYGWLEKVELVKAIIVRVGLVLGVLIILTLLFSSTNNIRLLAKSRAVGFQQMLLLGAGRYFIAVPFLIEGFLMAGLAAAVGWGAIYYGHQQVVFTQFELILPSIAEIAAYCGLCALLGLLSGWVGIRTELKER